jgi:hypothetical protein
MTSTETISLHELQLAPDRTLDDEHNDRQSQLDKKRVLALVGSALSQLPIWGESRTTCVILFSHLQVLQ